MDPESRSYRGKAYDRLSVLLGKGAVPHALLFTGVKGVGKRTAAMSFAMACNCLQKADLQKIPCRVCIPCKKIQTGNHPDIHVIGAQGPFIRINQVREVCSILALKPYEAKTRVVVIEDAQAMNPEAGNALLKVLEEPPDRTVLILTSTQKSDLLPTIVSRCRHILFSPVPRKVLAGILAEDKGMDQAGAGIIAAAANGSFSRAFSIADESEARIVQRDMLVNALGLGGCDTKVSAGSLLTLSEKLSKNKEELAESLEMLTTWLRDMIVCRYSPDKLINVDAAQRIRDASGNIDEARLLSKIDAVGSIVKAIRSNANVRLALDVLMMRLVKRGLL